MGFKGSWWGLHTPLNLPHRGSYPTGNGAWLEAANRNYVSVWIRNWQKKKKEAGVAMPTSSGLDPRVGLSVPLAPLATRRQKEGQPVPRAEK